MKFPPSIGHFEIIAMIARGGMGVVYKARDRNAGRLVALKVFNNVAENTEMRALLLNEAKLLGRINHPNIMAAYEAGEFDGNPYIAMELIEGETLDLLIRSHRPISIPQKLDVILQVSGALQYVHEKGMVHRDVKPGNIMFLPDGRAKLIGFDVAWSLDLVDPSAPKRSLIGTLGYMSPEQLNGDLPDGRTDIFSLGIAFYEFLEGKPPFQSATIAELIINVLSKAPLPSEQADQLRIPELQRVFDKALAKQKDLRYQSCSEFSQDLIRIKHRLEMQNLSA